MVIHASSAVFYCRQLVIYLWPVWIAPIGLHRLPYGDWRYVWLMLGCMLWCQGHKAQSTSRLFRLHIAEVKWAEIRNMLKVVYRLIHVFRRGLHFLRLAYWSLSLAWSRDLRQSVPSISLRIWCQ